MRTLADFKRAMQVGTRWQAYQAETGVDLGVREIGVRQSNCVGFMTAKGTFSYLYFPKAKDIEFHDDEVHIFWPHSVGCDRTHVLTYKQVTA